MRIPSLAYAQHSLAPTREPRYVFSIEFGASDFEYFASHDDIDSIPAGTYEGVVKDFSSVSQSVDPETGASRIGSMTVELGDNGGALTDLFQARAAAGYGLRQKTVRRYKGFAGMDWTDFQLQFTQIIYEVSEGSASYSLFCNDLQREMRSEIFQLKSTNLAQPLAQGATTMTVDDTSDFVMVEHGTSYSHGPSQTWGYLKLDDEVIGYTGKTSTTFTGLARGLFNTLDVTHTVEPSDPPERRTEVQEFVYLEMPVPKLVRALMTGDLYGQSATLPDHWHLSISESLINETQFEEIGDDLWTPANDSRGLIARFTGIEAVDGKTFIEKELFLLAQIFSPVLADGRLGLKRFTPALASAAEVAILGVHNVSKHGAIRYALRDVYNRVLINWGWLDGEYRRQTLLIDSDSIAIHGNAPVKVFSFRGLATNSATASVLKQRFDAIRDRFSSPPLHLQVDASRSMDSLEIGDVVRVQLPNVRDMLAESSNEIDRTFEIRQIQESRKGPIQLALVGSSAKATPEAPDVEALPDAYYDQEGTELSTVVDITAGVTDAGTFDVTGDPSMASAVYYYIGDLTISATTTINISDNVQLRVMGFLTINGTINGNAAGLSGVADAGPAGSGPGGASGYFGRTGAGDGVQIDVELDQWISRPPDVIGTSGAVSSMPLFNLRVNGNTLEGIPDDLRGTSGGPGGKLVGAAGGVHRQGGTGGDGGAGLLIVCRGLAFGGAGEIDLSGGDGSSGTQGTLSGFDLYPGGGAGGAPGALLILLDGDELVPDVAPAFSAVSGETPIDGFPLPKFTFPQALFTTEPGTGFLDPSRRVSNYDWSEAAYRVQFIPVPETPVEELPDTTVLGYYIKPINGTAIHNGVGTLTLEAHRLTLAGDELIGSGSVMLFDPADDALTVANGYQSGSDGYTGILDSTNIDGDIVISLKSGASGEVLDTITLVDIADGDDGEGLSPVFGFIDPENGLAWTQAPNAGAWTPSQLTTDLDCTFVQAGVEVARISRRLTLTEATGNIAVTTTTHPGGNLNTGRVTVTTSGGGSQSVTVKFSYSFSGDVAAIAETVKSVQGGTDGDDGADGSDGSDGADGEDGFSAIVIDTEDWSTTVTDPMGDWELLSGDEANTQVRTDVEGPFGEYPLVMEINGDGTNPGWYSQWRHYFDYDKDKSYVFYAWVKRLTEDTDTGLYFGFPTASASSEVVNLAGGAAQTNPYFVTNQGSVMNVGEWYLAVGIIYPDGYVGSDQGLAGLYSQDGVQIYNGQEHEWNGQMLAQSYLRLGHHDNSAPAKETDDGFQFTRILAYVRDGSEPSIEAVLGAGALQGQYKDVKFMRSATAPSTPTGDNPAGWTDEIPAGVDAIWQTVGTKTGLGTLIGVWSTPVRIISLIYRGAYSGATAYLPGDVVSYQERSYINTTATTGNAPTGTNSSNAYWDLLAGKGDTGATPVSFTDTIAIGTQDGPVDLRALADAEGYDGVGDATVTYTIASGQVITGLPGQHGIVTGTWPAGATITLLLENEGTIRGGGGRGGNGGTGSGNGAAGNNGGDAIYCTQDITIDNAPSGSGVIQGGGGGGGGGGGRQSGGAEPANFGGGGGGGGFPNGVAGSGGAGDTGPGTGDAGSAGTTGGGGAAGAGGGTAGDGGAGGGAATVGSSGANGTGTGTTGLGGGAGAAGYAVRKNGNTVTATGGTITGTVG